MKSYKIRESIQAGVVRILQLIAIDGTSPCLLPKRAGITSPSAPTLPTPLAMSRVTAGATHAKHE